MALPTETPHSRRKPGSTYPVKELLKSGSRLSPGMRSFWNVPPGQNVSHSTIRGSDSMRNDSGIRPAPQHRAFSCYALAPASTLGRIGGDVFAVAEPRDRRAERAGREAGLLAHP